MTKASDLVVNIKSDLKKLFELKTLDVLEEILWDLMKFISDLGDEKEAKQKGIGDKKP